MAIRSRTSSKAARKVRTTRTAKKPTAAVASAMLPPANCASDFRHIPTNAEWAEWMQVVAAATVTLTSREGVGLFRTNANPSQLWSTYMRCLPAADRQHHNCRTCRAFIERFGGIVAVDANSEVTPLAWFARHSTPAYYRKAIDALHALVSHAAIAGPFLPNHVRLGTKFDGGWSHLCVDIHGSQVTKHPTMSNGQREAQMLQERDMADRATERYSSTIITAAKTIVRSGALHRPDGIAAHLDWFADYRKANDVKRWHMIRFAPAGFAHIANCMAGALLDDVRTKTTDEVVRAFNERMQGDNYMRPKAAPAEGTIAQAEKLAEQLNLMPALARRVAHMADVQEWLWEPQLEWKKSREESTAVGAFAHLRTPKPSQGIGHIPLGAMTWRKFYRDILPTADKIFVTVPEIDNYACLATAVNPDSRPILQWDEEGERNPVSWYTYVRGSTARDFNLPTGHKRQVLGICDLPCNWNDRVAGKHGDGFLLIISEARDRRRPGLALFPEFLKSELHSVRSVIEAHSNKTPMLMPSYGVQHAAGLLRTTAGNWPRPIELTIHRGSLSSIVSIDRME